MSELIEALVAKHGEPCRKLIVEALDWLAESEPNWGLDEPINKDEYIETLVRLRQLGWGDNEA